MALGRFAAGNKIYVLSEIISVNADDRSKYKVKTASARFYVSEADDKLVTDPEQDIITATDLYNSIIAMNNMESEDFYNIFVVYNSVFGTTYDFHNLLEVFSSGMTYETLLDIYEYYVAAMGLESEIKVGDIVRVLINGDTNSKYCGVLHIDKEVKNEDETIITYTLYDADLDNIYNITREDAQIIKWSVDDQSSAPIESLINTIKDNISSITGDIDRTKDDPSEQGESETTPETDPEDVDGGEENP